MKKDESTELNDKDYEITHKLVEDFSHLLEKAIEKNGYGSNPRKIFTLMQGIGVELSVIIHFASAKIIANYHGKNHSSDEMLEHYLYQIKNTINDMKNEIN